MEPALDSNVTTANGIASLLQAIFGKTGGTETTSYGGSSSGSTSTSGGTETNSGGTETKQTMVNVQDMMKQLLEGAGTHGYGKTGLAGTLQQGRRAGVYGGKSTQLDLNDLLSRITTEASIAGAPTVMTKSPTTLTKSPTTSTETKSNPTVTKSGIGSQAGLVGGKSNLLPLLLGAYAWENRKKLKGMFDDVFGYKNPNFDATDGTEGDSLSNISDYISKNGSDSTYYGGLNNTAEPGGFSGAEQWMFSPASDTAERFIDSSVSNSFTSESFLSDPVSNAFAVDAPVSNAFAVDTSAGAGLAADYSAAEAGFAGGDVALGAEAGGEALGAAEIAGTAATAEEGMGLFEVAAMAWIICTELHRQRRLSTRLYVNGAPVFAAYPETPKRGYYLWAIPSTKHLRAHPNSLYSKLLCAIFNSRAKYLYAQRHATGKGTVTGFLITHGLYYLCYGIGIVTPFQNWKQVYNNG